MENKTIWPKEKKIWKYKKKADKLFHRKLTVEQNKRTLDE